MESASCLRFAEVYSAVKIGEAKCAATVCEQAAQTEAATIAIWKSNGEEAKMTENRLYIVFGVEHYNHLGIIRSLGESGVGGGSCHYYKGSGKV